MTKVEIKSWIKEFIFTQKCIPWSVHKLICPIRNRIFNINTKEHWDTVWAREKEIKRNCRLYPQSFAKIVSLIPPQKEVVDIGCGIGVLMERLKNEKQCKVFGIDISEEAIKTLTDKNLPGIVSKVPPVPLPSYSFEIAVATEILEHLNNPQFLLKEMIRLVKPSGFLIITVPDQGIDPATEREHVNCFNEKALRRLFKNLQRVDSIEIFRTKEEYEECNRLIVKVQLC